MPRPSSALVVLTSAFLLTACGGGSPTEPSGNGGGGGNQRTVKADPSFASDIVEIFNRNGCTASNCHGSGQGGLTMTSASTAYANLVDVKSPNSGEIRVIPGNANDSYLVKKLEGRQSVGVRMPNGRAPLDATDLTNIKNWINQGAKNN